MRKAMATKGETAMARTEYVIEPGKQEILSTTVFDAPREPVFKAYTDPNLLAQWWGPRRYETNIDTFEALGNKTRVVEHSIFESVMDRDGMVASGMQEGADESAERLVELLDKMKAGK